MVTAETAMVLPALVLVLALAVSVQLVVAARATCQDAARAGARAAARGEPATVVRAVAQAAAGRPAQVTVEERGHLVTVSVTLGAGLLVPGIGPATVSAEATSSSESS